MSPDEIKQMRDELLNTLKGENMISDQYLDGLEGRVKAGIAAVIQAEGRQVLADFPEMSGEDGGRVVYAYLSALLDVLEHAKAAAVAAAQSYREGDAQ